MSQKKLAVFSNYEQFKATEISKTTPIYVDKNLSNGASGYSILKSLHESGYKNLHLTTGEFRNEKNPPKYVASIVSKEFPFTA